MNIKDETGKLYYVGGCVRDEILGVRSLDVDICYEGDVVEYVKTCGFEVLRTQEDIRTARVLIDGSEVDFASTRKEVYPKQGHLPVTVEIGCDLKDDLIRRDFTVNSIAKSVATGEIVDLTGGLKDIELKLLRVHHKDSFKDDPTRIIRGLKFSLRFGFELEEKTRQLQEEYLSNVNYDMSYSRLKKELVDTFNLNLDEGLKRFVDEGIYKLVSPCFSELPIVGIQDLINEFDVKNPWLCYLGWLDLSRFELTKEEKKVLSDYAVLRDMQEEDDFTVYKTCKKSDIRAIILWIMMSGKEVGLRYLRELQYIKLETTGDDLVALGFAGKQIGELLDKILIGKLKQPQLTKSEELMLIDFD